MIRGLFRRSGPVIFVVAAAALVGGQAPPPPPPVSNADPLCTRLEGYLANVDRGNGGDARAEQVRRYEEAAQHQQQELDRMSAQAQRTGCSGSGFFLFGGGQPPQCDRLNNQIQNMRANLDRINVGLAQLRGNLGGSDAQRRQIMAQLAQNNCGPQYRNAAAPGPGGLLDTLFGNNGGGNPNPGDPNAAPQAGTFRTICVRTCDGFFFPVSYSTVPSKFADDERTCQRMCPAAEAKLYSYHNPGGEVAQAVASDGRRYSELPTAFRYRQEFNASCSCRQAGQSWADALKHLDDPVEQGDIVVTPERAKAMSQPKADVPAKPAKQNTKNTKTDPKAKGGMAANPAPTTDAPPAPDTPPPADGKRTVRVVGPQQLAPAR